MRREPIGGLASSRIREVHGDPITKRTFNRGVRIQLHQKDLNLALDGARKLGIALPHTASAQQLFSVCAANGGKAWDHSALIRALELMANFEIAQAPQEAKAA